MGYLKSGGAVGAGRSPNPEAAEARGHGEVTTTSTALTVCRLHLDRPRHLWKGGHGQGGRGQSGARASLNSAQHQLPKLTQHTLKLSASET